MLNDVIGFRIRRIQNHISRAFSERIADKEVRPGVFSALALISANPGLSQSLDRGSEIGYTAGYATGLKLKEKGGDSVVIIGCCDLGFEKQAVMSFDLGLKAVDPSYTQTYVQSGNVVFKAGRCSTTALSRKIEDRILADFGFPVPVISRSAEEMSAAARGNPFVKRPGVDLSRLHITFLSSAPLPAAWKRFAAIEATPDEFRHSDREIYLFCPNGIAKSKLFAVNLGKDRK